MRPFTFDCFVLNDKPVCDFCRVLVIKGNGFSYNVDSQVSFAGACRFDEVASFCPRAVRDVGTETVPSRIPRQRLGESSEFYGGVLGCEEGRSTDKWIDFDLFGHQIVAHHSKTHPYVDHFNPVDGDEVPVPHFGVVLKWKQFEEFAERLKSKGVSFIIEPHVRFPGMTGEQYTMFFKDPAGNNLEFKALKNPEHLFEKFTGDERERA